MEKQSKNTQRLTIWAAIMILLGLMIAFTLSPDQSKELFAFLKEIIIHLIAG